MEKTYINQGDEHCPDDRCDQFGVYLDGDLSDHDSVAPSLGHNLPSKSADDTYETILEHIDNDIANDIADEIPQNIATDIAGEIP